MPSKSEALRERKIRQILSKMTLKEKVGQLAGIGHMKNAGVERLGVGQFRMADGPVGVRHGKATCFPGPIAMAATWDPSLIERTGMSLGTETIERDRNILLAPCINIHRHPLGGRNFESFGEDPYLAGKTAAAYIRGLQSTGAACSVKHFAVNNQEKDRLNLSAEIDERSLREVYLPAFKAAIQEGGAWTVMAAYNQVNGRYCVENEHLLVDILKNEWGFDGLVMSDWGATWKAEDPARRGLDLEMPDPKTLNMDLVERVKKGSLSESAVDDKVLRILRIKARLGLLRGVPGVKKRKFKTKGPVVARQVAADSIVLLKNQGGLLPLDKDKLRSLAVIGPDSYSPRFGGGGSAIVDPPYAVSVLEGLKKALGPKVRIKAEPGCLLPGDVLTIPGAYLEDLSVKLYPGNKPKGKSIAIPAMRHGIDIDWINDPPIKRLIGKDYLVRFSGWLVAPLTGKYRLGFENTHVTELILEGKSLVKSSDLYWTGLNSKEVTLHAGKRYKFIIDWKPTTEHRERKLRFGWSTPENLLASAVRAARSCDAAVVVAGFSKDFETEGKDRENLELYKDQVRLINAVCEANPRTVVALINGGAITAAGWLKKAKAVLECWYPGQEGGNAIADVLFGRVNPSGRLPMTFPESLKDIPASRYFPGTKQQVLYKEGMAVGYRHFDRAKAKPAFAFGYGLSYTRFEYSGLKVTVQNGLPDPLVKVEVTVRNAGAYSGKEVAQLFVEDVASSLSRPKKELKAFKKVSIQKGRSQKISWTLKSDAFAFYHDDLKRWVVEPGAFKIHVGRSAGDIRQGKIIKL